MTYAVVDKSKKRIVAIIDSVFESYFRNTFTVFSIIEIESIGTIGFSTGKGLIIAISVSERGNHNIGDEYYMIKNVPEGMNLDEAYEIIQKK